MTFLGNKLGCDYKKPMKRNEVPEVYGEEYNIGNWNCGHVSLPGVVVLFVTTLDDTSALDVGNYEGQGWMKKKDAGQVGSRFRWMSQNATTPDSKRGREILENKKPIHLYLREHKRKNGGRFTYQGSFTSVSYKREWEWKFNKKVARGMKVVLQKLKGNINNVNS